MIANIFPYGTLGSNIKKTYLKNYHLIDTICMADQTVLLEKLFVFVSIIKYSSYFEVGKIVKVRVQHVLMCITLHLYHLIIHSSETFPSLLHFPVAMFVILSAALCGAVQGLIRVINTRPRTVSADNARKRVMSVVYNCLAMKGLMATRDTNAFHTRNLKL